MVWTLNRCNAMVTTFDISQEIFSIDMLTALKSSLKHHHKHVLRPLQLYGDQALDSSASGARVNYVLISTEQH